MSYKLETVLLGGLTALMIVTNGQLSRAFGNPGSNVIIHLIGLSACIGWYLCLPSHKVKTLGGHRLGFFEISGGLIGYLTVWLTNASFMGLGVAATLALAIAGQTIFATLLDKTGCLGTRKRHIVPIEYLSLLLTLLGAGLLTLGGQI